MNVRGLVLIAVSCWFGTACPGCAPETRTCDTGWAKQAGECMQLCRQNSDCDEDRAICEETLCRPRTCDDPETCFAGVSCKMGLSADPGQGVSAGADGHQGLTGETYQCGACPANHTGDGEVCTRCPDGKYNTDGGTCRVQACVSLTPPDSATLLIGSNGETYTVTCNDGYQGGGTWTCRVQSNDKGTWMGPACTACAPGRVSTKGEVCALCPLSTYAAGEGNTSCKPWSTCPKGQGVTAMPSPATDTECEECDGVSNWSATDDNTSRCTCQLGYSPTGATTTSFGTCAANDCTATSVPNSTDYAEDKSLKGKTRESVVVTCADGYQGSDTATCKNTGTFSAVTCTACGAGTYSAEGGSCEDCLAGEYATNGAGSCTACGAGTYSTASATSCNVCSPGKVTDKLNRTGATSCTACSAGTYSTASTTSCSACAAGSVTDQLHETGATSCTACGAGTYSTASTRSCAGCDLGHETKTLTGQTSCSICSPGQYASTKGSADCSVCGRGSVTDSLNKTGASSCTACSAGAYSTASTTSCIACAIGSVTNKLLFPGSSSCTACSAGTYSTASTISCAPHSTCDSGRGSGFFDDFSSDQASKYRMINDPWSIEGSGANGRLKQATSARSYRYLKTPYPVGDGVITAKLKGIGDEDKPGLITRHQSNDDMYRVEFFPKTDPDNGSIKLYKRGTELATAVGGVAINTDYTVSFSAKDNGDDVDLSVIVNGLLRLTFKDTSNVLPAGEAGLSCAAKTTACVFDDFSVPGTTADASNDTHCVDCSTNTFSSVNTSAACALQATCPAGSGSNTNPGQSADRTCSTCSGNTFSGVNSAAACQNKSTCSAGQYVTGQGDASSNRSCGNCSNNTYTTHTNQSSCDTCNSGYAANSNNADCDAVLCNDYDVPNSSQTLTGSTSRQLDITCDTHYEGGGTWECQPNGVQRGTWTGVDGASGPSCIGCNAGYYSLDDSGPNTCTQHSCPDDQVLNANLATRELTSGNAGDSRTVTCNTGYHVSDSPTTDWLCPANANHSAGTWTGTDCTDINECAGVDCGHGGGCEQRSGEPNTDEYTCSGCDTGYQGATSTTATCGPIPCTDITPPNSTTNLSGSYAETRTVTCQSGYNTGFFSHTFTNCGKAGFEGPSLANCKLSYNSTGWASNSSSFTVGSANTDLGYQIWTVPATGTYQITAHGASGGGNPPNNDQYGRGAMMQGDFELNQGDQLRILVGQKGGDTSVARWGSGGGGGTFVALLGGSKLIIAGGGGGGGDYAIHSTNHGQTGTSGMDGSVGSTGSGGATGGTNGGGGSKGSHGGGGAGWSGDGTVGSSYSTLFPKSFLGGGVGGEKHSAGGDGGFGGGAGSYASGGGGGGYSGGGGGQYTAAESGGGSSGSGGGGGGSFNSGSNPANTAGANDGHGYVSIEQTNSTWTCDSTQDWTGDPCVNKSLFTKHDVGNGDFMWASTNTYQGNFNAGGGFCTSLVGVQAYIVGLAQARDRVPQFNDDPNDSYWVGNGGAENAGQTSCSLFSSTSVHDQGYAVNTGYSSCDTYHKVLCTTGSPGGSNLWD